MTVERAILHVAMDATCPNFGLVASIKNKSHSVFWSSRSSQIDWCFSARCPYESALTTLTSSAAATSPACTAAATSPGDIDIVTIPRRPAGSCQHNRGLFLLLIRLHDHRVGLNARRVFKRHLLVNLRRSSRSLSTRRSRSPTCTLAQTQQS